MPTYDLLTQDAPFSLLAGGLHRCDPTWDKQADSIDHCYKLYLPIRGQARLVMCSEEICLRPGMAYLIPGYHLARQECRRRMDVYWFHFVPTSPYLALLLSRMTRVHVWHGPALAYWRATCRRASSVFSGGDLGLFHRVQAMLLDVVAQVLETCDLGPLAVDPTLEQLKPAIAFMDQNLMENPKLADIAKTVHLAPNYFHRKFTAAFRVTPFHYMLDRRLNLSRQLLLSTDLTLESIARRCGFCNAFHLSKLFKKHHGQSPRQLRRRMTP